MQIETYTDKYSEDVTEIAQNFFMESLGEYDGSFDRDAVFETIERLKTDHADNAFLLIIDDKCVGMLAGFEIYSLYNRKKVFQELIWYVNEPHRRHGIKLFKEVIEILKQRGIETLIMAVMENSKTKKIKNVYEKFGLRPFESHYIGSLN